MNGYVRHPFFIFIKKQIYADLNNNNKKKLIIIQCVGNLMVMFEEWFKKINK